MSFSRSKRNLLKQSLIASLFPTSSLAASSSQGYQASAFMNSVIDKIHNDPALRKTFSPATVSKLLTIIGSQPQTTGRRDIQHKIKTDFSDGNTLLVQGFIFSHTEITLCLCYDYLGRGKHVI